MQFEENVINFNTKELPKELFLYFTKKLLIEANNSAIREKRSRVLRKEHLEEPKETEAKRPYPNEREWQETVIRKPVRKQFNFRKEVLNVYSNQCAVCSVNVGKLLRAAHILSVTESSDDSVNNGICLCINHEIAFDNNLLIIKPNGDIITTDDKIKVEYNKIRYPKNKKDYPSQKNILIRYNKSNNKN